METTDKLAHAGTPDIAELSREFSRSLGDGRMLERIRRADDVRYCVWPGQSDDGKKWSANMPEGRQAFPWEGASDTRIPLSDQIVNDLTDTLSTAHARAQIRVAPVEATDAAAAQAATTLMRWVGARQEEALGREAELLAQYVSAYGHAVAFVGWEQRSALRTQRLRLDEIAAIAAQSSPDSVLADLPQMVLDPLRELETAALLAASVPKLSQARARRVVRELRADGLAEFAVPYVCKNEPVVIALKPWEDVSFPPETIDLQRARVLFRRQFLTEVELRSKVVDEEWSEAWVNQAVATAGKGSAWTDLASFASPSAGAYDRRDNLVEVVWAYTRQLGPDGVPGVYYTIFSPLVGQSGHGTGPDHAKHEMLDYAHGEYPFILFKREHVARRVEDSRGVPEVCATWQQELKAQRDSIFDATSFETLPPIQVTKRLGLANKIGPAVQLPVTKPGDYEFMRPPARQPSTAFNLIEAVQLQADAYFGRANGKIAPIQTQLKQQRMVNEWLRCWGTIYRQMFRLCIQYYSPEELTRIVHAKETDGFSTDAAKFDFQVRFNVAELDTDLVKERLATISSAIVPLDVSGRIDRAKLVEYILRAVVPESAGDLLLDQQAAGQAVYNGVKNDVAQMLLGIEATYADASHDAGAPMKLQYAREIVAANPKATNALQSDPLFADLMKRYVQNLEMGAAQQQNRQVGRIGVKPRTA